MPAYSFQKQFVGPVERGEKTHTIRSKRKLRPKPGQRFVGYYAQRTKQCRKLVDSNITRVQDIIIEVVKREAVYRNGDWTIQNILRIEVDGETLALDEMETLAVRDGFPDLFTMGLFWPIDQCPFFGDLIHWRYPGEQS